MSETVSRLVNVLKEAHALFVVPTDRLIQLAHLGDDAGLALSLARQEVVEWFQEELEEIAGIRLTLDEPEEPSNPPGRLSAADAIDVWTETEGT